MVKNRFFISVKKVNNIFIPNYRDIIPKCRTKGHEQVCCLQETNCKICPTVEVYHFPNPKFPPVSYRRSHRGGTKTGYKIHKKWHELPTLLLKCIVVRSHHILRGLELNLINSKTLAIARVDKESSNEKIGSFGCKLNISLGNCS